MLTASSRCAAAPLSAGKMATVSRSARRQLALVDSPPVQPADFSDPESQRVFDAAARAVAFELGRQAAREMFTSGLVSIVKAST